MGKIKIKPDERNYRRHSDKNKRIIKKSLSELGAGRSILIDADDQIVAGNGVYEQAEQLGIPVRVIETDGTELIAVKRKDLQPDSEQRRKMALLDNHASDTSDFDFDLVGADFDVDFLDEIEFPKIEETEEESFEKEVVLPPTTARYIYIDFFQCEELYDMIVDKMKADMIDSVRISAKEFSKYLK